MWLQNLSISDTFSTNVSVLISGWFCISPSRANELSINPSTRRSVSFAKPKRHTEPGSSPKSCASSSGEQKVIPFRFSSLPSCLRSMRVSARTHRSTYRRLFSSRRKRFLVSIPGILSVRSEISAEVNTAGCENDLNDMFNSLSCCFSC